MFEEAFLRGRGRPKDPESKIQRALTAIRQRPMTPREISGEVGCTHKYARRIVEILIDKGYASRSEFRRYEPPRRRERIIEPDWLFRT